MREGGKNKSCSPVSWGDVYRTMSGRATASREKKKWPSGIHGDAWLTTLGGVSARRVNRRREKINNGHEKRKSSWDTHERKQINNKYENKHKNRGEAEEGDDKYSVVQRKLRVHWSYSDNDVIKGKKMEEKNVN